jgi:aspartate 1-decarboxylase
MMLKLMKSKIHRATVTRADLNYEGSIAMDAELLDAAGLLSGESVHVWNLNNGERFETYALPLARSSGEICVNGAAARLVQVGDLVIVTAFCWIDDREAKGFTSKVILVDARNKAMR